MSTVLRTQFLNYMTLQRFSKDTKRHYVMAVNGLAKFHNQSPDKLTNDQIQEYFRHLLEDRSLSWGTCNNYFSGMRKIPSQSTINLLNTNPAIHELAATSHKPVLLKPIQSP